MHLLDSLQDTIDPVQFVQLRAGSVREVPEIDGGRAFHQCRALLGQLALLAGADERLDQVLQPLGLLLQLHWLESCFGAVEWIGQLDAAPIDSLLRDWRSWTTFRVIPFSLGNRRISAGRLASSI